MRYSVAAPWMDEHLTIGEVLWWAKNVVEEQGFHPDCYVRFDYDASRMRDRLIVEEVDSLD